MYRTVHRFAKNSIGKKVTDYNVRDALVEPLVAQMVSATLYFQRTMWVHFLRCPTMCPHTGSFRCSKQGGLLATSWYAAHRLRRQASTNKSAMEHRHSRDCFERWHSLSSGRAFGLSDGCTRPAPEATSSRVLMCRVTTPMFATSNVRPLCSCMSSRTAGTTGTLSMKSINDSIRSNNSPPAL